MTAAGGCGILGARAMQSGVEVEVEGTVEVEAHSLSLLQLYCE